MVPIWLLQFYRFELVTAKEVIRQKNYFQFQKDSENADPFTAEQNSFKLKQIT